MDKVEAELLAQEERCWEAACEEGEPHLDATVYERCRMPAYRAWIAVRAAIVAHQQRGEVCLGSP